MHIALCDDNVADRKQFERLIKRESDRRASADGTLFVDSFGNARTLLSNPMQYDAFYIDLCHTPGITGWEIVNELLGIGVQAPIILCCSEENYKATGDEILSTQSNILFMDKPIRAEELSASIDHALEIKKRAVPTIELRIEEKTYYITEPDILYAIQNGTMLDIYLTDGRQITVLDTAKNFFSQIKIFPVFFAPTKKTIINGRYIEQLKFFKAIMSDGKVLKIEHAFMPYAKKIFSEYHASNP